MPAGYDRAVPGTIAFRGFVFDGASRELRRAGTAVDIARKPCDLLAHLVAHRDRVVPKSELLNELWPGIRVSEDALTSALRDLRRALNATGESPVIATVRGRGYRFVAAIDGGEPCAGDPFVGRAPVLQRLVAALRDAVAGAIRISLLAGPPGIGKTRLALEVAAAAREVDAAVHSARCYRGDGALPFWPWLDVVRGMLAGGGLAGLSAGDRARLAPLAWLAPDLVPGTEPRRDLDVLAARFRLFDALAAALRIACRARPRLVVVDDLHWADEASLLCFEFLVEQLVDTPLHLVCAFRDGEVAANPTLIRAIGAVARHAGGERIDLDGLGCAAVSELLAAAAGREPPAAFTARVHDATAGNPFFVTEIARLVSSAQIDVDGEGAVPVPVRVRDAVRLHLAQRSHACQELLQLASVIGRNLELAPLASALGRRPREVVALLEEAEAAGLVRSLPAPGAGHAFVHDLVRETLYRAVERGVRAQLHRRMAAALEACTDDRLEEIAYHYAEASVDGEPCEAALSYARRAAERAVGRMACEDAVAHYQRALDVLQRLDAGRLDERCRLLLAQAEAAWGTLEDAVAVRARFIRAAEAARAVGCARMLARAALGYTGFGAGPGDFRDIGVIDEVEIDLLTEASTALGDTASPLHSAVLARLALATVHGARAAAEAFAVAAVAMAEQLDDPEALAHALRYRHEVISGPRSVHERIAIAGRLLSLARAVGSRPLELDALFFLSRGHFELGDVASASAIANEAGAIAVAMRHPGAQFRNGTRRVLALTLGGAFAKAGTAAEALFVRDAARNLSAMGTLAAQRIAIAVRQGRADDAIALLEVEAVRRPVWALTRATLGAMYLGAGRIVDAHRELDRIARDDFAALAPDHTWLGCIQFLADLCLALREPDRARTLYRRALPFQDMVAAPYLATTCDGAVARGLGVLAHAMNDRATAALHFRRALDIERRLASPPLIAATLVRYASLLLDGGDAADRDHARSAIDEATAISRDLDIRLPLAELRAALGRGRSDRRSARHKPNGTPSPR
jgi:DNA-binding winged helix-turn-helix (wHTH) protein/tetratricopeptide (TPR) repeat protein